MSLGRYALPLICLALAACTPPTGDAAAPANSSTQTAAAPASCDSPAAPLAIGADASGSIPAAQAYPANARYFCLNVANGTPRLTLTLSGMSTDLDLYVGSGSIASVQGVDISAGENYQWKSNEFGNGDETVVIENPAAGIYYAEIVSFQGQPSDFNFSAR